MIVLVGASASGKTETAKLIIKNYGFKKMVTTTTRPMRVGEVQDIDYHFISKEEFLKQKENGEFLETTEYNNNFYGTHRKDVDSKKVVIVEPEGANNLYKELKDEITIFYLESSEEKRIFHMTMRGDKEEDIKKRIESDKTRFSIDKLDHIDYVIDSDKNSIQELAKSVYELYKKR